MSRNTWCPPEYRAAYDALTRKKIRAAEARAMIEDQMKVDAARSRPVAPPIAEPEPPCPAVADAPRRAVGKPAPRVGDLVQLPGTYDPMIVQIALNRRKNWKRARSGGGGNHMMKVARLIMDGNAETVRRESDPVERAKSYLRRQGYIVYDGSVLEPRQQGFVVGRRTVPNAAALIDLARKLGWAA
ncbi:hypothetical protein [Sphingomonas sanxanigenens]|uniref:Uncharacterized protein n=1 Tax=Sphingomonas sanxanigenens DSM 19645 = NX02 TaxID=1123269 RepID=W0AHN0_9SPHN|nr:hypothetical protein [Sphingomonas sanxanigenens]AHE56027.1 hypothetical protein NX02_22005 [Sphingomonas sanxanigenens DSM 19645 = NX02]